MNPAAMQSTPCRGTRRGGRIRAALIAGLGPALWPSGAAAQAAPELPRVEITGSWLRRPGADAAMPVQVVTQDDIRRSGGSTTTDLLQALPAMQGFVTNSQSVNGGGGGGASVSLHSIGSGYTLVLLNGRRVAAANTGTTVNINAIPLAAIERVELLLGGASATYGADAIGGVVNIVTKGAAAPGELTLGASRPQHAGARSRQASVAKGFGRLDVDRFELLLAASAERQDELNSAQRPFSATGFIPFTDGGRRLTTFFGSTATAPANVFLTDSTGTGRGNAAFNPFSLADGRCAPRSADLEGLCRFDFANTTHSVPPTRLDSLFAQGRWQLAPGIEVFGEWLRSDFSSRPRFAPPPLQFFLTQAMVARHVTPSLPRLGLAANDFYPAGDPDYNGPLGVARLVDAGGRQEDFRTVTTHAVAGVEGQAGRVDYQFYLTRSRSRQRDTPLAGYLIDGAVEALIERGAYDPLAPASADAAAVLAPALRRDAFYANASTLQVLHAHASASLLKLDGGDLRLALGAEALRQRFADVPVASGVAPSFDSRRRSSALFAEAALPVSRQLDLTLALRIDRVGAVTNSANVDLGGQAIAAAEQGRTASASTWQLAARLRPSAGLQLRASAGTGFKVADMADITSPVQAFGSTGLHDCPPGLPAALARYCQPFRSEYNIRSGGNPGADDSGLLPERSTQWSLGAQWQPTASLDIGIDWWGVAIDRQIAEIPEDVAFADGATYATAFSVVADPQTGAPALTFNRSPRNAGRARYEGIDLDVRHRADTPFGRLSSRAEWAYLIRSDYAVLGLAGLQSSLGRVGVNAGVSFRWQLKLSAALEAGRFQHTLGAQVRPSYTDQVASAGSGPEVRLLLPDGSVGERVAVTRRVASYTVFDWQTRIAFGSERSLTLGIRNLFDRAPPFTIADLPGTGNVRGFDARYTEPIGRALYVRAGLKF